MKAPPIRYRLDFQDRIRSVSGGWLEFARRNGATALELDAVVSRPLWDFVAGKETRHLYSLVFEAARNNHKSVSFPFRCDSPTHRRYMQLSVAPLANGALEIATVLVWEEPRPYAALFDPDAIRDDRFLTVCSWCKCVLVSSNEWGEVETAIRRLDLFGAKRLPQLTHGVCATCESQIDASFEP